MPDPDETQAVATAKACRPQDLILWREANP